MGYGGICCHGVGDRVLLTTKMFVVGTPVTEALLAVVLAMWRWRERAVLPACSCGGDTDG